MQPKSVGLTRWSIILAQQHKPPMPEALRTRHRDRSARAVAANNLAWLYAETEQFDVALQLAQTAKREMPRMVQTDDTIGWIYYKKGMVPQALAAFSQAVAADPGNAVYLYHLGLVQLKDAKTATARESLERALKINPGFEGAEDARKVLRSLGTSPP